VRRARFTFSFLLAVLGSGLGSTLRLLPRAASAAFAVYLLVLTACVYRFSFPPHNTARMVRSLVWVLPVYVTHWFTVYRAHTTTTILVAVRFYHHYLLVPAHCVCYYPLRYITRFTGCTHRLRVAVFTATSSCTTGCTTLPAAVGCACVLLLCWFACCCWMRHTACCRAVARAHRAAAAACAGCLPRPRFCACRRVLPQVLLDYAAIVLLHWVLLYRFAFGLARYAYTCRFTTATTRLPPPPPVHTVVRAALHFS